MYPYEKVLVTLFCLGCIAVIYPGSIMLGAIAFVLPGLILGLSPTAFVYLLGLYPAVLLRRTGASVVTTSTAAISGISVAVAGTSVVAAIVFNFYAAQAQTDTVERIIPLHDRQLHLVLDHSNRKTRTPADPKRLCGALCQGLLRLASVDAVYVSDHHGTFVYRLASKTCGLATNEGGTNASRSFESCFAFNETPWPKNVSLLIEANKLPNPIPNDHRKSFSKGDKRRDAERRRTASQTLSHIDLYPVKFSDTYRVEVFAIEGDQRTLVGRRTYLEGQIASVPFVVESVWAGGTPSGSRLSRTPANGWEPGTLDMFQRLMKSAL